MSAIRQSPAPEEELEFGKEVEYVYDQVSFHTFRRVSAS